MWWWIKLYHSVKNTMSGPEIHQMEVVCSASLGCEWALEVTYSQSICASIRPRQIICEINAEEFSNFLGFSECDARFFTFGKKTGWQHETRHVFVT
jgi:hypothetical protein